MVHLTVGQVIMYLYGVDKDYLGGLGNFYLLVDQPEVYALPQKVQLLKITNIIALRAILNNFV